MKKNIYLFALICLLSACNGGGGGSSNNNSSESGSSDESGDIPPPPVVTTYNLILNPSNLAISVDKPATAILAITNPESLAGKSIAPMFIYSDYNVQLSSCTFYAPNYTCNLQVNRINDSNTPTTINMYIPATESYQSNTVTLKVANPMTLNLNIESLNLDAGESAIVTLSATNYQSLSYMSVYPVFNYDNTYFKIESISPSICVFNSSNHSCNLKITRLKDLWDNKNYLPINISLPDNMSTNTATVKVYEMLSLITDVNSINVSYNNSKYVYLSLKNGAAYNAPSLYFKVSFEKYYALSTCYQERDSNNHTLSSTSRYTSQTQIYTNYSPLPNDCITDKVCYSPSSPYSQPLFESVACVTINY